MILVLTNGEKIDVGERCTWCFYSKFRVDHSNQVGITNHMSVNQNCDPIDKLSHHNTDGNFFKVGKKLIPIKSVCYIEE